MIITQIENTLGNYLNFPDMKFPLDAEGLRDVQLNNALLAVLGNIGGERYYLAQPTAQTQWNGFAYVPTQGFPSGELLYIDGEGNNNANMQTHLCLVEENVDITANYIPYPAAYRKRKLVHGINRGIQQFAKTGFQLLETNASLKQRLNDLTATVNAQNIVPRGAIIMWSGTLNNIPSGWALCDGTNGTPNLQGRFIVGASKFSGTNALNDADYAIGSSNALGRKTVTIQSRHLPNFTLAIPTTGGTDNSNFSENTHVQASDGRFDWEFNTNVSYANGKTSSQYAQPLEMRPSYYALAYIIKL